MPDENKFEKLREIGYHVPATCGTCVHGRFLMSGHFATSWGTCGKHRYEHKKHDNPEGGRGVSVVSSGTCRDAQIDPARLTSFGAHAEFVDGR